MSIVLTGLEARIIGCLMEKEVTTPDYYPLTANSLLSACNQKSSREPVMNVSAQELSVAMANLSDRRLVTDESGFNSRAAKYSHRFCNTEFGDLKFNAAEKAVVCVLLLRGPQTPGELRSRCQRMHEFSNVTEVEGVLTNLATLSTPLVSQLPREPGKRESRFQHLFISEEEREMVASTPVAIAPAHNTTEIQALTAQVAQLQDEVDTLKQQVAQLLGSETE
jgi:uncharacterized protein YceH (UPF0502 family)